MSRVLALCVLFCLGCFAALGPGARDFSTSWTDRYGFLYIFGGYGYACDYGYLNDLWAYKYQQWYFIGGNVTANTPSRYGQKGYYSRSNWPGGRGAAMTWVDSQGNVWLFGGGGLGASSSYYGVLNDLWKYSQFGWAWVNGPNIPSSYGNYGQMGIASTSNLPGARYKSVTWIDRADTLWLFGGFGYDSLGTEGYLNDLWKYENNMWVWMSGNSDANVPATYGTQGKPSTTNSPGARYGSMAWLISNFTLYLYGGNGHGALDAKGSFNDIWKYSIKSGEWTWVGGSNQVNQSGVYLDKNPYPGARYGSVSWLDRAGNFWVFGGQGYDGFGKTGYMSDLWKLTNNSIWSWEGGPITPNGLSSFGSRGVPSRTAFPGGTYSAVGGVDNLGSLWLFGGFGYSQSSGYQNSLWQYYLITPYEGLWSWEAGSKYSNSANDASICPQGSTSVPHYPTYYFPSAFPNWSWPSSSDSPAASLYALIPTHLVLLLSVWLLWN